jgi:hypothetical protein
MLQNGHLMLHSQLIGWGRGFYQLPIHVTTERCEWKSCSEVVFDVPRSQTLSFDKL